MKKRKFLDLCTVREVTKVLKLHPYTSRRFCREGKILRFKFGGIGGLEKMKIDKWLGYEARYRLGIIVKNYEKFYNK